MSSSSLHSTQAPGLPDDAPSPSPRSAHLPQLDGVRGIAILTVMLFHLGAILRETGVGRLFTYGWSGVDLFFALSGFLITRILIRSRSAEDYWSRFYTRRILRIWPLYYAFMLLNILIVAIYRHFQAHMHLEQSSPYWHTLPVAIGTPLVLYLFLAQNFYWPSIFAFTDLPGMTWSLCIEEHFYLVWPFLIRRLSIVRLKYVMGALLLLSPLARLIVFYAARGHASYLFYYQMATRVTPLHVDGLAAGSLLALFWNDAAPAQYRKPFAWLFGAGLLLSAALLVFADGTPAFVLTFSALAALFAGLIGLALTGWQRWFLTRPTLRYAGKVSYALYLIHPLVYRVLQSHSIYARIGMANHVYLAETVATILAVAISFLLAGLSWKFFESPILRLKNRVAPE